MKPALGKGLSALIPEKKNKAVSKDLMDLDIKSIVPNEYQPRRTFGDHALNELVASIKEKGVIQPVIVRKSANNVYQLIAGESAIGPVANSARLSLDQLTGLDEPDLGTLLDLSSPRAYYLSTQMPPLISARQ